MRLSLAGLGRAVESDDLAYNLRYEVMATIFYSSEAPAGYSALPGV